MSRKVKIGRLVLVIAGLLLLIWSALAVVTDKMMGVGVVAPGAVALGVLALSLWWKPDRKGWRIMAIALCALVILAVILGAVCTALMVKYATAQPAENATVVVLGSKIHGDRPSRMLRDRLNVAADYLDAHPQANCVVAGGLGPGETHTEAYVMKKYLVEERGIAPDRIAQEDASTNTRENLAYSMAIIRERGWNTHVVTATQIFHQYRAGCMALSAGADSVGGVACHTPTHLLLNYWVRECVAIGRYWILGI